MALCACGIHVGGHINALHIRCTQCNINLLIHLSPSPLQPSRFPQVAGGFPVPTEQALADASIRQTRQDKADRTGQGRTQIHKNILKTTSIQISIDKCCQAGSDARKPLSLQRESLPFTFLFFTTPHTNTLLPYFSLRSNSLIASQLCPVKLSRYLIVTFSRPTLNTARYLCATPYSPAPAVDMSQQL